jgi:hypothetical protein
MDAYFAEVVAEALLEEAARLRIQRLAGRSQRIMNDGRCDTRQSVAQGSPPEGVFFRPAIPALSPAGTLSLQYRGQRGHLNRCPQSFPLTFAGKPRRLIAFRPTLCVPRMAMEAGTAAMGD